MVFVTSDAELLLAALMSTHPSHAAGVPAAGRQRGQRAVAAAARRKLQPITLDDSSGDEDRGAARQQKGDADGAADDGGSSGSDFEVAGVDNGGASDEDQ